MQRYIIGIFEICTNQLKFTCTSYIFQGPQHNPWLFSLMDKLLRNDPIADELITFNPFANQPPPRCAPIKFLYCNITFSTSKL